MKEGRTIKKKERTTERANEINKGINNEMK